MYTTEVYNIAIHNIIYLHILYNLNIYAVYNIYTIGVFRYRSTGSPQAPPVDDRETRENQCQRLYEVCVYMLLFVIISYCILPFYIYAKYCSTIHVYIL